MNPVGIEFLTTVPEATESTSASPAGQGAHKGEFLSQFLGMLFADPPVDAESNGQLSSASDGEKESVSDSADTAEGPTRILEGSDPGNVESEIETLPQVATRPEDPVWVAPAASHEVVTNKGGEAAALPAREDISFLQEEPTKRNSIAFQKENDSVPLPPREADQSPTAQAIEEGEKQDVVRSSARESSELSSARDVSENRESKFRIAAPERPRPEGAVFEAKAPDRTSDPARTSSELGNPRSNQPVSAPDQTRSPSVLPEPKPLHVAAPGQETSLPVSQGQERLHIAASGQETSLPASQGQERLHVAAPGQETSLPASQGQERLHVAAPGQETSLPVSQGQERLHVAAPGQETSLPVSQGQERLHVAAPGQETSLPVSQGQERLHIAAPGQETSLPVSQGQERLHMAAPGQEISLPASQGQERLPITSPAWVPGREGLVREDRGISVEARKIEVDVFRPPTAAADLGSQLPQNGSRNQSETDLETREEQLLRRLVVSRNSGQVEENKAVAREAEPVVRFQVEPERSIAGTSRSANPETAQPSETPTTVRFDASGLQGSQRLTVHEPQLAREMVNLHRAEDFDRIADQIVKRMSLSQKGETFQLGVRLKPEFLGEVRIETIMDADRSIRAVIHAEDSSVKALLEGKVSALAQRFEDAGIHVDKVEVQTLPADVGSGNDSSKDRHGLGHSENEKGSHGDASELEDGLEDDSEEEIDDGHIHLFI